MLEQLAKLSLEVQVLLIISASIIVLFLLFILLKKGIRLKGKGLNISINGNEKEIENKSPHAECVYRHHAIDLIRQVWKNADERGRLKYSQSVKLQMEQAEVFTQKYIQILIHVYLKVLQEKGFADPVSTVSFNSYKNVLKILENSLLTIIRHAVRENNFAEKNSREFEEYVRQKIQQLADFCMNVLNDTYLYKNDVNTAELYEANKAAKNEFEQISNDFFFKCRQIAVDINEKIKYLDSEDDKIFLNFKS